MASFNPRRFADPDFLKTIDAKHLLALLRPFAAYFERRDVELPAARPAHMMEAAAEPYSGGTARTATNGIDYERLAGVLVDPDDRMPAELVDGLYLINEMSTPEGMDELLEVVDGQVALVESDEQTPADVATQVFLKARHLLERRHAERFVGVRQSFVYFLSKTEPNGDFTAPSGKTITDLEQDLGAWFFKKKKGDQVRVFVYPKPDEVWFLVRHGEGFRREGAQKGGQSTCVFYRPEKHDIVVYNPAIGELRINAGSDGERNIYRQKIGLHVFGTDDHFPGGHKKYSLEPLRANGAVSLVCTDVDGMESAHLVELAYFWGGAHNEISIHKAGDVFGALADRDGKVHGAKIIGAKFRVKFADSKTPRMVSIRPPNVAKFTRDEDGKRIDEWLALRGFSSVKRGSDDEAT